MSEDHAVARKAAKRGSASPPHLKVQSTRPGTAYPCIMDMELRACFMRDLDNLKCTLRTLNMPGASRRTPEIHHQTSVLEAMAPSAQEEARWDVRNFCEPCYRVCKGKIGDHGDERVECAVTQAKSCAINLLILPLCEPFAARINVFLNLSPWTRLLL